MRLLHLMAARRTGLRREGRGLLPHITLARLNAAGATAAPFLTAHGTLASEPSPVLAFDLIESTLTPAGAQYETARRYCLDAR